MRTFAFFNKIKHDITMPEDISALQSELEKVKAELRFKDEILKNLAEGVYLIKADEGTIVYTNPKFEDMFGYSPGEMIGKNVSIVNAPTKKSPEETAKEIIKVLEEKGEWQGEIENIKKDGTKFWCYANVSMFDHPEYGRVMISIHTDITDRKKAEEKAEKAYDAQKKMNQLMIGRELKMIELKQKIIKLENSQNLGPKAEVSWKDKFMEGEALEEVFVTRVKDPYFQQIDESDLPEDVKKECKNLIQVLIDDSTRHLSLFKQMEAKENGR